ncbi:MAG TPA: diacylglycerol kinase family protein [Microlunatus sp.]|jgi:diacylglycerol kinase (ATP)|nr:diacylglycerol kinase family protein [Microlunatus sp.]
MPSPSPSTSLGRCAVIFNPIKVSSDFRDRMSAALAGQGCAEPVWLPTSEEDPGQGRAAEALEAEVDRVIVAGGDGTVRAVADGLAGSAVPLGIVPAGTANLLNYNLGLPRDEAGAIDVAVAGDTATIDLIKITIDDRDPEHFAVMAGAGLDAMIMDEVSSDLKSSIGTAAYFVAAGKALGRLPMSLRITVDGRRIKHRKAIMVLIANVGGFPPNIELVPGAAFDDGLLDLMVASPRRLADWLKIIGRMIIRRQRKDDALELRRGKRVEVVLEQRDSYQLDGDVAGEFTRMTAEIVPGALHVVLPADRR